MVGGITRIFSHRAAGPLWCGVALLLALALAVTSFEARRKEDFLRGRIAALASHDASQLQAELVSCRATVRSYTAAMSASGPRGQAQPGETTRVRSSPGEIAEQLAANPPAGFDVCARMESADQAVLKALDRR
jgi:hypothetical protein